MPARGIIAAMSLDSVSSQQSTPAYRPTATVQAIGSRWGVAAGDALAAEAAAHLLGAGGNAVDAGVAAGICLGVVHVDMVSVAGVAPILVHLAKSRETFQVSGVGPYPAQSTPEFFRTRHGGQIAPGLPRTVAPAPPASAPRATSSIGARRPSASPSSIGRKADRSRWPTSRIFPWRSSAR